MSELTDAQVNKLIVAVDIHKRLSALTNAEFVDELLAVLGQRTNTNEPQLSGLLDELCVRLSEPTAAAEREACCADVCWRCRFKVPVERIETEGFPDPWMHRVQDVRCECAAAAIRERAYRQAEKGEAA